MTMDDLRISGMITWACYGSLLSEYGMTLVTSIRLLADQLCESGNYLDVGSAESWEQLEYKYSYTPYPIMIDWEDQNHSYHEPRI